jgi:RNA polymerase sigma factor (sigma-70 family)
MSLHIDETLNPLALLQLGELAELDDYETELHEIERAQHPGETEVDQQIRRQGIGELYVRHYDAVHNLARILTKDPTDADDLTQATFEKMMKYINTFTDQGRGLHAWLQRVETNQFLDTYRRKRSHPTHNLDPSTDEGDYVLQIAARTSGGYQRDVEEQVASEVDLQRIITGLCNEGDKTDKGQNVTRERLVQAVLWAAGYTKREVAELQGVAHGTVNSGLARLQTDAKAYVEQSIAS